MAGCGVEIDKDVLDINSPEIQMVKNALKDSQMKTGMQQLLSYFMKMVPENMEDKLVTRYMDMISHTSCLAFYKYFIITPPNPGKSIGILSQTGALVLIPELASLYNMWEIEDKPVPEKVC